MLILDGLEPNKCSYVLNTLLARLRACQFVVRPEVMRRIEDFSVLSILRSKYL